MSEQRVINFMGRRKLAAAFSVLLLLGSIVSLATNGLQFGLDFTGGTQIEVGYEEPANLDDVRQQLDKAGFEKAVVVHFGSETDVLVRMQRGFTPGLGDEVMQALKRESGDQIELRRVEFVGPQVGEELRDDGGLGMLFALAVVMLYVAMRFQYKFSVGAVAALAHDVILVLGFFSVLGLDFDLTVLAAVLAVIGYSLNDTIVVSDRIRENFRKLRGVSSLEVINVSLSQTLGRTLITSLTTLLVLLALFFFGGEMIHGFSTALLVGVLVGTYSSIYVAANVLLAMNIDKEDLMQPIKEGEEFEEEVL
jgi:preprotein translocase subunit SecF